MLLLSDADRTDAAASLLPDVLHMLATTHAELGKYRRAAEYFNRALAACNTIYGKGHVRCCPVLRGWARMAVRRQQDHTLAAQLLRKEKDVREAHMGRLTLTLALTLALALNPNPDPDPDPNPNSNPSPNPSPNPNPNPVRRADIAQSLGLPSARAPSNP